MSKQKGSAILLSIAAVLVGIMAIWILAWVPLTERSARAEVNLITNRICDIVASKAPLTKIMWNEFKNEIKLAAFPEDNSPKSELKFGQILNAYLYVAGPNDNGQFPNDPAPGVDWKNDQDFSEYQVFGGGVAVETDEIIGNDSVISVKFYNSFRDAPISPYVVNDIRNFGNTAVCVVVAKAKDSLLGIPKQWLTRDSGETFQVVSGSWNPVQGVNSIPPLPAPSSNVMEDYSSPGVILAIAPQLPELDLAGHIDSIQEPLLDDNSRFKVSEPIKIALPNLEEKSFIQDGGPGRESINGVMHDYPGVTLPGNLDTESPSLAERRIGCANSLAMVRAAFTSTLTQLMSRHGQLRKNTQVLLVNGRKFNRSQPNTFSTNQWAPPAVIVPAGSDLAEPNYQLPYVTMEDFANGGWSAVLDVNATRVGNALEPNKINWKSLLAGQLSHCAHVYGDSETGTAFQSSVKNDAFKAFEPLEFDEPIPYHYSKNIWQRNALINNAIPLLPAFQVLAQIGNTRTCPVHHSSLPSPCNLVTIDPSENIFLPDIEALSYFTSPTTSTSLGANERNFALFQPGALVDSNNIDNPGYTFADQAKENPKSSIAFNYPMQILVIHTLNAEIVDMLGDWRDSGRLNKLYGRADINDWGDVRPFRLVIIPATPISLDLMTELSTRLGVSVRGARAGLNRVTIIEPCELNDNGERLYPDFCNDPENPEAYYKGAGVRSFWEALLDNNPETRIEHNIYQRAEEFFRNHVVTTSRIL